MKLTRIHPAGIALAVIAALFALAAFPVLMHMDSQTAGLLMLANGPVALPEIKQVLETLLKGFEDFKQANNERLAKLEKGESTTDLEAKLGAMQKDIAQALDLKKQIEQLESKSNLAGLFGGGAKSDNPDKVAYKTAFFDRFVRKGDIAGLSELASKAMSIGSPTDGGVAVPEQLDRNIERLQRDLSPMRQLANVVVVGTSDYKKLVNTNGIASGWVGETAARPETNTSKQAELTPFMGEIYANPQVTQQALDDIFYDVEGDVTGQLIEEFAIAEGAAFFAGNGVNKPKGFLAYPNAATGDSARPFGTLEYVPTGVAGDWPASNRADFLIDIISKLKAGYRAGSSWTMGKALLFEIMKIKDSTGQYLWQPRLTDNGLGMLLLGYAVNEAEDMPVKAANSLSLGFGNWKRGYTIVDRIGMRMMRDPFTNKPYVGFYTTKRVGGMVVNSEAIKLGKFGTS